MKTIKRAIEIAAGDGAIKMISLDAGKYNAANGEKYPYTLPTGVTMVGATGTTLAGNHTEDGLVVDTGTVENIEFSDFNTALRATSAVTLADITVKTSNIGVLADGSATVQATALTIVGDAECKTIGVKVIGTAQVTISSFIASDALALDGRDQAAVSIANGTVSSKTSGCFPQVKMFGKSLALSNTTITGGRGGLWLNHDRGVPFTKNPLLAVQLMNTTIADAGETGMISEANDLQMTGGEIRNNSDYGAQLGNGVQTFTGVGLKGNFAGLEIFDQSVKLKVRGSTITGNKYGVIVDRAATIDLGTAVDPGSNTILNSLHHALYVNSPSGVTVFAAGNTWAPNTDDSDGSGRYATQLISGIRVGSNFFINLAASSIQL